MIKILTAQEARKNIKGIFVLIHGAGVGGWVFRDVALLLRMYGYEVHTPTLSGLAEHSHVPFDTITLSTHIRDIVDYIKFYGLKEVNLLGHSYGGSLISGVVNELGSVIKSEIYLDSFFLESGESILDIFGKERGEILKKIVAEEGEELYLPKRLFGKPNPLIQDMPFKPYLERVTLKGEYRPKGAFIDCLVPTHFEHLVEPKKLMKKRSLERGWKYYTLDSDHVPMTKSPQREELVELLLKIVED